MRLLALALCCSAAMASAAEPVNYDVKKLVRMEGASFAPGDKHYPAELANAGVQGTVLVVVPLTDEGKSDGAVLGESSRSAQLDQLAVDAVKELKFTVKAAPEKGWKAVILPVEFSKDSLTNLKQKTCADFNADYAYYQATYPEQKPEQMRLFEMLTGVLYVSLAGSPSQAVVVIKRSAAARQPTIDGCKARPEGMFYETWVAAVKAAK